MFGFLSEVSGVFYCSQPPEGDHALKHVTESFLLDLLDFKRR